jgi:hypothetical protein
MQRTTTDSNDFAQHFDMLKEIGTSQFHLEPEVAEAIAEDVLLASLRHWASMESTGESTEEWLTGAMQLAVQSYLGKVR